MNQELRIKRNKSFTQHHFFPEKNGAGFTLIEVLVGTFLVLIVFLGIFGAYQLGLKVVGMSKNKIIATAVANGEIEKIRNLPYLSIGTKEASLPFAQGILDSTTTVVRNNIEYKIETQVKYIIDEADGTGAQDSCNWDYKRAEIKVSWSGQLGGEVKLVTDIAPKNKVEEISACIAQPGGILSVEVANSSGVLVSSPLIEIINPTTGEIVDFMQPSDGTQDFPLAAGTYKVAVSKSGYNSERTFGVGEEYNGKIIITVPPEISHPLVIEGKLTKMSFAGDFAIDKVSSFSVDTLSPWGMDYFSDSFSDSSKISESSDVEISEGEGEVVLEKIDEEYKNSGYLVSKFFPVVPEDLLSWDEFSFSDNEPAGTQILYQFLYFDEILEEWVLIPDSALPCNPPECNSTGFGSPVDLSELSITTYPQLELKGYLSTADPLATPVLYDWQVSWKTSEATPIANAVFDLKGEKIIGYDADEEPIYKYSQEHISNGDGHLDIPDLEWDFYTFLIDPATDLYLVNIDPETQPIYLPPDTIPPNTTSAVKLYLDAENSLLVIVKDIDTGEPIPGAKVKLYKTGYEETQYTGDKGQTYFIPLEAGTTYTVEVSLDGYESSKSENVFVSGYKSVIISLQGI